MYSNFIYQVSRCIKYSKFIWHSRKLTSCGPNQNQKNILLINILVPITTIGEDTVSK